MTQNNQNRSILLFALLLALMPVVAQALEQSAKAVTIEVINSDPNVELAPDLLSEFEAVGVTALAPFTYDGSMTISDYLHDQINSLGLEQNWMTRYSPIEGFNQLITPGFRADRLLPGATVYLPVHTTTAETAAVNPSATISSAEQPVEAFDWRPKTENSDEIRSNLRERGIGEGPQLEILTSVVRLDHAGFNLDARQQSDIIDLTDWRSTAAGQLSEIDGKVTRHTNWLRGLEQPVLASLEDFDRRTAEVEGQVGDNTGHLNQVQSNLIYLFIGLATLATIVLIASIRRNNKEKKREQQERQRQQDLDKKIATINATATDARAVASTAGDTAKQAIVTAEQALQTSRMAFNAVFDGARIVGGLPNQAQLESIDEHPIDIKLQKDGHHVILTLDRDGTGYALGGLKDRDSVTINDSKHLEKVIGRALGRVYKSGDFLAEFPGVNRAKPLLLVSDAAA